MCACSGQTVAADEPRRLDENAAPLIYRGHFKVLSISAHARATDEFAPSPPGKVAQPPFSMNDPCWYELTFFSSTMLVAAPALCWNLSTQIGESADMTADVVLFWTISFAVPPVTQPPQLKPTIKVMIAPPAAPCSKRVS